MKPSKLTSLLAATILGSGIAYAQDNALPTETVNIMMDKYGSVAKFKGATNTECYMTFVSYSERSNRVNDKKSADYALYKTYSTLVNDYSYEIYIDIWADIRNQSGQMKSIIAAGKYMLANNYDADVPQDTKGTFYSSYSFIRQFDADGNWVRDLSFPNEIEITEISGNRYEFSITTSDGETNYEFLFGYEDTNNTENLKWSLNPLADDKGNVEITYEEYVELDPTEDPEKPTPSSPEYSPTRPTGIETIDGDVAQISFDGNTINLGATADAIVVDACGRVCLHTVASSIDGSNLASGIYIVKAGNRTLKFLKK